MREKYDYSRFFPECKHDGKYECVTWLDGIQLKHARGLRDPMAHSMGNILQAEYVYNIETHKTTKASVETDPRKLYSLYLPEHCGHTSRLEGQNE
jgi:hypothetical protein